MATNLTDIIKKVRTALRGEEVRGSIADGLEYCGQISENAKADMAATAAATKEQLSKDIDAKAAAALKSIPESYTELDGSVKQLEEDRSDLDEQLKNLYALNYFVKSDIQKNKYCENGLIKDYDNWNCSGFIKIQTSRKVSLITFINGGKTENDRLYIDCYKKDRTHVRDSTFRNVKLGDVNFPDEAYYFLVSGENEIICNNTIICETSLKDMISAYFENTYVFNDYLINDINKRVKQIELVSNDSIVRSIARIGYDVYNINTPPQQSIKSFKLAYEKGFRILLCDLRFTSDNIAVCSHDDVVNYAKNADFNLSDTDSFLS